MTSSEIAVALRVLTAINNRISIDQTDVDFLHSIYPEAWAYEPEELACLVLDRALAAKKADRKPVSTRAFDSAPPPRNGSA